MAIYKIGETFFVNYTSPTREGYYTVYYDSGTKQVYFEFATSDGAPEEVTVSPTDRQYNDGDFIESICEGTTKISGYALLSQPFATVTEEIDSPDCAYVPPITGCDLLINSLVATNETSTGANDGTLTVNASSSNAPIEYSIDGTTWQTSNYFGLISPGGYTVYLRDANLCTQNRGFGIDAYINPVQNFTDDLPVVSVGSNISRWNAAFNPIVVIYQRKDFSVTSVLQNAGNPNQVIVRLNILLNSTQISQALNGPDYVKTALYDFYAIAQSHTVISGVSNLVFNVNYSNDDTVGYLNISQYRTGYEVQTEITYGDNPVTKKTIISVNSPDNTGRTNADLSGFLKNLLSPDETYNFVDASYRDYNLAQSFTIRFREVWDVSQSQWYSAPYPLYVTYAAAQLGEEYGGNRAAYVPFESVPAPSNKAKFLTDFKSPVLFSGLPFEISFIYSEEVINKQLVLELIPDCGGVVDSYLLNDDAGYLVDGDLGRFIINRVYNPLISGFPIIEALGVNRLLIPDVFDCCATKIKANIYFEGQDDATFNYTLDELLSPFIDANLQIKDVTLGTFLDVNVSGSGSLPMVAGHTYAIEGYSPSSSGITNAKIRVTIHRGATLIYDSQIPQIAGASMIKGGTAQPGAAYTVLVKTLATTTPVTPVDIPDTNPVITDKTYIMQDLIIRNECKCDNDPYVYLKWINSRGGWDYYRFGYNQTLSADVTNNEAIKKYVSDWENQQTIEDVISKSSIRGLTIGASLIDSDTAHTLQWLLKSRRVQMLTNGNPVKWQTVIVKDGSTPPINTRKKNSEFSCRIFLPSDNIQNG